LKATQNHPSGRCNLSGRGRTVAPRRYEMVTAKITEMKRLSPHASTGVKRTVALPAPAAR